MEHQDNWKRCRVAKKKKYVFHTGEVGAGDRQAEGGSQCKVIRGFDVMSQRSMNFKDTIKSFSRRET